MEMIGSSCIKCRYLLLAMIKIIKTTVQKAGRPPMSKRASSNHTTRVKSYLTECMMVWVNFTAYNVCALLLFLSGLETLASPGARKLYR